MVQNWSSAGSYNYNFYYRHKLVTEETGTEALVLWRLTNNVKLRPKQAANLSSCSNVQP